MEINDIDRAIPYISTHVASEQDNPRSETLDRYRESVRTGVAADYVAESNTGADMLNHRDMVSAHTYSEIIIILGHLAGLGDLYAYAAKEALRAVALSLNDWQIMANVAFAFSGFIRSDWTDTRAATGPEAGRPSSHVRKVTLREAVVLHLTMVEMQYVLDLGAVPGPGWCLKLLARETGAADCTRLSFPRVAAAL